MTWPAFAATAGDVFGRAVVIALSILAIEFVERLIAKKRREHLLKKMASAAHVRPGNRTVRYEEYESLCDRTSKGSPLMFTRFGKPAFFLLTASDYLDLISRGESRETYAESRETLTGSSTAESSSM